jgi:hypothetical protein
VIAADNRLDETFRESIIIIVVVFLKLKLELHERLCVVVADPNY